jgi:hypothetical protein
VTWPGWRLILEQVATLRDLDMVWSINDIADANEALDAWHEAEAAANERE